jgi:hypothetical protein
MNEHLTRREVIYLATAATGFGAIKSPAVSSNAVPQKINTHSNENTIYKPYLSAMLDKAMFCPGALAKFRYPTGNYEVVYITYQYFNYPPDNKYWIVKQPNLSRYSGAAPSSPLWACLTVAQADEPLPYLSHDMVQGPHNKPKGMSTVRVSGQAEWIA